MRTTVLKELSPENQQRVLWLHNEAFGGKDVACKKCPGNCCYNCGGARAYLDEKLTPELKAKYGWHERLGFQREHGCSLPLAERSDVCLSFACGGVNHGPDDFGLRPPVGVNRPFKKAAREALRKMRNIFHYGQEEVPEQYHW